MPVLNCNRLYLSFLSNRSNTGLEASGRRSQAGSERWKNKTSFQWITKWNSLFKIWVVYKNVWKPLVLTNVFKKIIKICSARSLKTLRINSLGQIPKNWRLSRLWFELRKKLQECAGRAVHCHFYINKQGFTLLYVTIYHYLYS